MDAGSSPPIAMIQACEAAIARIRTAIRAGNGNSEAVGEDFMQIHQAVRSRFTRYARTVSHLAPEAAEEALDTMFDRLLEDVWSLTYVSLETQFGAYLHSMPTRVLFKIRRKYLRDDASSLVDRLDAIGDEDSLALHEALADPLAEQAFTAVGEREVLYAALDQLPPIERHVLMLRLHGHTNNAIAQTLGVSPTTATRIYQQASAALRQRLGQREE